MQPLTHSPNGFLICPICGKENQRISKASPLEYAAHPTCQPEYKRKQAEKFKQLRARTKLAFASVALLTMTSCGMMDNRSDCAVIVEKMEKASVAELWSVSQVYRANGCTDHRKLPTDPTFAKS